MSTDLFMTSKEVIHFINNYKFSRKSMRTTGAGRLETMVNDLMEQSKEWEVIEAQAYNKLNVANLNELQSRINTIAHSSLAQFSASAIRESKFMNDFGKYDSDTLRQGFQDYIINNHILEDDVTAEQFRTMLYNDEDIEKDILIALTKIINEGRSVKASYKEGGRAESVNEKKLKGKVSEFINYLRKYNNRISLGPTYKSDFIMGLRRTGAIKGNSTFEITANIDDLVGGEVKEISYYPYYDLTPDEQLIAREISNGYGRQVWQSFKHYIARFVSDSLNESEVSTLMEKLGPEPFFKNTLSGVQGILGELQGLFIMYKLIGADDFLATGPIPNELKSNRPELGADILMDEVLGIQIKNYKPYNNGQGYHLKQDYAWATIREIFKSNPNIEDVETYFTVLNYNQPISESFAKLKGYKSPAEYAKYYSNFSSHTNSWWEGTRAFFASQVDKLFTFDEIYTITKGLPAPISNQYTQAFYFFNGHTIVPVSYIYRLLAENINKLNYELQNGYETNFNNFSMDLQYDNFIKWPTGVINNMEQPTKREVMNHTRMHFDLNLYLDDLKLEDGGPYLKMR